MAPTSGYNLAVPGPNDPLTDPSHSALHGSANTAINDLDRRVGAVEDAAPGVAFDIEQARLAAHTVMVRGPVPTDLNGTLLVPVIWNLTGREVTLVAAKVTLLSAADADFEVLIVNGAEIGDQTYDPELHSSVLQPDKRLVVPAGETVSASLGADDFALNHSMDTYLAVVIIAMGSEESPGGWLTVQLNRNL